MKDRALLDLIWKFLKAGVLDEEAWAAAQWDGRTEKAGRSRQRWRPPRRGQESIKEPEKAKRAALDTLKAWMRCQGDSKDLATVDG